MTSEVLYLGGLRTTCTHLKSGKEIITDAPTDNNGKGDAFSPTDTVATGLASCMITMMGIYAENNNINLTGTKASVLKVMAANPRRISEVHVQLFINNKDISSKERSTLEHIALNCPVAKSLHPDIQQLISFSYPVVG